MINPRKLRLVGAIALVCAMFLPLSQCSRRDNHSLPPPNSFSEKLFPRDNADYTYQYGFNFLELKVSGIVTALAFVWPLLFVLFDRKRRSSKWQWGLLIAQLLLCAGSAYWIHAIMLGGRWLYGAYLALAAVLAFAAGAVLLFRAQRDGELGRDV